MRRSGLADAASAVLGEEPVVVAYLFGSRAREDHRPGSDVDIAVLLRPDVAAGLYLELSLRYARELDATLGLPVSPVVVLNDSPLRLQGRVLRDARILFVGDDDARVAYEARTRQVAMDFEIKAVQLDRLLLAAHARGER